MSYIKGLEDLWGRYSERPSTARERAKLSGLITAVRHVQQSTAATRADERLSPLGKQEKVRSHLAGEFRPALRGAQDALREGRERLSRARAALSVPAPDRTDVVGALIRAEMRAAWKALPLHEQLAMITPRFPETIKVTKQDGVIEHVATGGRTFTPDLLLIQAITEVPFFATGLPHSQREVFDRLMDTVIDQSHPGALEALAADEEDYTALASSIALAKMTAQELGEFASDVHLDEFLSKPAAA